MQNPARDLVVVLFNVNEALRVLRHAPLALTSEDPLEAMKRLGELAAEIEQLGKVMPTRDIVGRVPQRPRDGVRQVLFTQPPNAITPARALRSESLSGERVEMLKSASHAAKSGSIAKDGRRTVVTGHPGTDNVE